MKSNTSLSGSLAEIKIPANKSMVSPLLSFVGELAAQLGFDDPASLKVQLLIEEAFSNVIKHAYVEDGGGFCNIEARTEEGRLALSIRDQGLPFDFSTIGAAEQEGIGSKLMKAIADEIEFLYLGKAGKQITFRIKLPERSIDDDLTESEKQEVLGDSPEVREDIPTLRPIVKEDAVAIARCVYRVYGYTYLNENFYYPSRIAEQIERGKMVAFGGFNKDGEIVCYWGVTFHHLDDKVVESANAVVDPRYRGHDLFAKIVGMTKDRMKEMGVYGINSKAVTAHPASQKTLLKIGGKETGVVIANSPASSVFKNMNERTDETRRAVVMFYTRILEEPRHVVFPPERHAAMVERIYTHAGMNREIHREQESALPESLPDSAQMDVKIVIDWARADLKVLEPGKDLIPQIKFRVRELCQQKLEVIVLDLPILHPSTAYFCVEAEKLGFFFCGILPEPTHGDYLRLIFLNHVKYAPEQTVIVSDFAKELHNYVVSLSSVATGTHPSTANSQ